MGNCHAVDAACATLEHPDGKVERLDYSSSARQLMIQHPGHYVALVPPPQTASADGSVVHLKQKQKLLPPDTMLNIGSCYRLVSFEDVLLELSDTGNMAHQTSRKKTNSNTTIFKQQHQRTQPVKVFKETSDVGRAAVKHIINQLRAMLFKSLVSRKKNIVPQNLPSPAAPAGMKLSPVQTPLQSLYSEQRGGTWRPNLQSISERVR